MIAFSDIQDAYARIRNHVIHTPLVYSSSLSSVAGTDVYLKLETLQKSGSFKVRGALNAVLRKQEKSVLTGVVTASAGNHAQGVAIAAQVAGIPATVVMPVWASLSKQEAVRGYGAKVILSGSTIEESLSQALTLSDDTTAFIHPFDDEDVIAGQGTIACEILSDLCDPDAIVIPVGGGGLIAGISVGIKSELPSCRIIGVQSEACPSAMQALVHGRPVPVSSRQTIADGIRVAKIGEHTFPVIRDCVDRTICVSDDEISESMLWLLERKKILGEGAGAAAVAALLFRMDQIGSHGRIILVISGGNVDSHQFFRIIRHSLLIQQRLLRISVLLEDQPGSLASLLTIIAEEGGNILQIFHNPGHPGNPVQTVQVDIEMETRGADHTRAIYRRIESGKYRMVR